MDKFIRTRSGFKSMKCDLRKLVIGWDQVYFDLF